MIFLFNGFQKLLKHVRIITAIHAFLEIFGFRYMSSFLMSVERYLFLEQLCFLLVFVFADDLDFLELRVTLQAGTEGATSTSRPVLLCVLGLLESNLFK